MALRVMQICVPQGAKETARDLLEGRDVLGRWNDEHHGQTVLHLLVPAEETEPIMDQFEQHFASVEGFHVVLFPVEAVLPRPKVDEKPDEAPEEDAPVRAPSGLRVSREELYAEVTESVGVSRVFIGMTILSSVVAAVGLMRDDVAVIIGAMVIAPLLGPNVAMSLATTLGDTHLLRRAVCTNVVGVVSAFLFAVLVGAIFTVDAKIPAIASRTDVGLGDILLALAAGTAGTLAFTRGLSGAVIGVMVAVALVPPLVVAGILLGAGQPALACGALLLTGANVICINLAGIVTFLAQGVRPRTWWETERAKSGTFKATIVWTILLALLLLILWLNNAGLVL
ncbi:MAG: TIGR00341 family protein [Pirellulaceae bacterium]|nr:TIGR00341 family protein [Pirellulaceae bacterium]